MLSLKLIARLVEGLTENGDKVDDKAHDKGSLTGGRSSLLNFVVSLVEGSAKRATELTTKIPSRGEESPSKLYRKLRRNPAGRDEESTENYDEVDDEARDKGFLTGREAPPKHYRKPRVPRRSSTARQSEYGSHL